jgi:hypothetical protein
MEFLTLKTALPTLRKTSYETTRTINEVNKILAGINDKENMCCGA